MSTPDGASGPARPVAVLAAALALLGLWGSAPLLDVPGLLRRPDGRELLAIAVHVLATGGGLLLAASALSKRERLLAFTLLAANLPLLLILTKWALIAGLAVAAGLVIEAFLSGATGDRGLDPYDARLLAASGAATLAWLLLLAGSKMSFHGPLVAPGAMAGVALVWAAVVPGLIAVYQIVRALLAYPEGRDRRALAPLIVIVVSLVRVIL